MKLITTSYENKQKSTVTENFEFINEERPVEMQVVNIYPEVEYQTYLGFGGAITEASGYAYSKLSKENQRKIVELYYGEEGNRYNMARGHIDSCDFSLGNYSAITDPSDTAMETFTLERDEQYIIPLMKAAIEKRGEPLDLLLSPWSPPAFMKTNGEKNHGGKLKPEYREFWAEYICRYIKEYNNKGLKVSRLTVQNEPAAVQSWDSCIYSAQEEKEFVRDFLYPAFVKNGLTDVKINIWDHNKEIMYERAKGSIDQDTDKMIDGIAFHWYTGDHFEAIELTQKAFPGKELIFTEGCVEYSRFGADQLHNAQMYAHDIMGNLNAGMTGFLDWNILLDEKGGPNHVNNFCDAPIMIDTVNDTFEVKLSFDYIGHFSRYINKGAKRIALTKYTDKLEMTAFKNPDGSIVLVALNCKEQNIPVTLRINGKLVDFVVAKQSMVTAVI
ncbi:MAG: glycoside hydrolase family 30 [Herbinix sp.]|jgi:glucosylceramidase|nr:glycoside hydrolase family 30 [Herbinix sp.]